jgi:hypothetical protein
MKNKEFILIILFFALSVSRMNAQLPYIIIDKDGYTNIREQPNSKSRIVGKIQKYQIFFSSEICGDSATTNWEPIISCNIHGYIYRKNICPISMLSVIKGRKKGSLIECNKDDLRVIMEIQPFDEQNHKDGYPMINSQTPASEIKKIEIYNKGDKTVLSKEILRRYYDIAYSLCVYVGKDGELYINFEGGGSGCVVEWYSAWLSIVSGKLIYYTNVGLCI